MKQNNHEKGQALIIIAFAAVVLIGFTALAIDGARVFEDKRHAQNAADTGALAGALAYSRDLDIYTAAQTRATENGYDDNGTTNDVTITITTINGTVCPANLVGREIRVDIESTINTTFGKVLGRDTMTSNSTAVARACGTYSGPPFSGNAIVALAPTGTPYYANGNTSWDITGGGIYSNSTSSPSTYCNGSTNISVPSITIAGSGTSGMSCAITNPGGTTAGAPQYSYESASAFFPKEPTCNGASSKSGTTYTAAVGADGSNVDWPASNGENMHFNPGVYCLNTTASGPGPYHGTISGDQVTLFITNPNFTMSGNGGGEILITAPISGKYKGIAIYLKPYLINGVLQNTQTLEISGNGSSGIVGSIIAPSADVLLFGNSVGDAIQSQIIGYEVKTGGGSLITVSYDPNQNYQETVPYTLSLLE